MKQYPIYLQSEATTCGVYCIKMILKYYGIKEEATEIKKRARVNESGTTMKGLVETLKSYNIETKAYHASLADLNKITMPCILHVINEDQGHFVVLYEIKDDQYIIGDPAIGLVVETKEKMSSWYSENLISITHIGRYENYSYYSYKDHLKEMKQLHKKQLQPIVSLSLYLGLCSLLLSGFYSILVDYIKSKTSIPTFIFIVIAYLMVGIMKEALQFTKNKKLIYLKRDLDKHYMYRCTQNIMNLPEITLGNSSLLHNQLIDLYQLSEYTLNYFETRYVDMMVVFIFTIALTLVSPLLTLMTYMVLVMMYFYVKKKSQLLLVSYKKHLKAHNEHAMRLYEYIDLRDVGKQYLGVTRWGRYYQQAYEKEASSKQDYEEDSLIMKQGVSLLNLLNVLLILVVGFYFYYVQMISMGQLMLFLMAHSFLVMPVLHIVSLQVGYKQNELLYDRYKEFVQSVAQEENFHQKITTITVSNLSYGYGYQEDILKHLDLTFDHTLFLRGENGSGKTTLLKLLCGMDKNYRGEIFINQTPLKKIETSSLLKHIVYVAEPRFIKGSLWDNLMCQDTQKVIKVFKELEMEEYVSRLNVMMNEEGGPFSKGQAQLIALARALLKEADVYLLDEALSYIDEEHAYKVITMLKKEYKDKIFIIVTHQTNLMNNKDDYAIIQ